MIISIVSSGFSRLAAGLKLVRLRPFGNSTPESRANERHRLAFLTALASALARIISIATALISVPLTLRYLGPERYGMWMTMSSIIAMLAFADFGIGNGILNAVSTAHGRDRPSDIRGYVSSGFVVLSAIAIAILLLLAVLYNGVLWFKLFNVTTDVARREAGPALAALVVCFACAIPLGIVQRVQMGLQRGFLASIWQCVGSLLGLIGVIIAIAMQASLPLLILAFVGSPLIASVLNNIVFFGWSNPQVGPRAYAVSGAAIRQIAHIGLLFFVLQIVGAVIISSDNIVIAHVLGPTAVTAFAVPQRLFSTIPAILGLALAPLWPAYSEATARGDHAWVWRTLTRSFYISVFLAALVSFSLVCVGKWVIQSWVGHAITPAFSLLLALGLWQVVQVGGNAISMYLNGANVVRFQVIVGTLAAIMAIILKIYWVRSIGISGAVWATTVSFLTCVAIPTYFFLRKRVPMA